MDLKPIVEAFGTHLIDVLSNLKNTIHNNIHTAAYDDASVTKKAVGARDILGDVIGGLPKVIEDYLLSKVESTVSEITDEEDAK